jgi:hypothetical protein
MPPPTLQKILESSVEDMDILQLIPGGVLPNDHWHRGTNDRTCSRCRREVPDEDVPLMLWSEDGEDMLIYCEACLGDPLAE